MSSMETAELICKSHQDVLRDIRRMLKALAIGVSKFADTYAVEEIALDYCEWISPESGGRSWR